MLRIALVARLRRAAESGVNIVFGTDVMADVKGQTHGQAAMEIIDSFTEAGISPLDTLRAMTVRAAELLGVASERGALRVGMAADQVAMPTSPLRHVNVLKHIDFVMRNGTVVRQA